MANGDPYEVEREAVKRAAYPMLSGRDESFGEPRKARIEFDIAIQRLIDAAEARGAMHAYEMADSAIHLVVYRGIGELEAAHEIIHERKREAEAALPTGRRPYPGDASSEGGMTREQDR